MARTEEFGLRDLGQGGELRAEGARGEMRGFFSEAGYTDRIERENVDVGALRIGVIAIGRRVTAREIDERVPKAANAEQALA